MPCEPHVLTWVGAFFAVAQAAFHMGWRRRCCPLRQTPSKLTEPDHYALSNQQHDRLHVCRPFAGELRAVSCAGRPAVDA